MLMTSIRALGLQTMRTGPSIHDLESVVQQLVVSRILYPRLVLPASHELDECLRAIVSQCVHHSIGLKQQGFQLDTAAAIIFGSKEDSLGMGLVDPAAAAAVQDYRRLLQGSYTDDDLHAAATWGALHRAFGPDGCTKVQPGTEDTVVGRLKNLLSYNVMAHRGGGTTRAAKDPPRPDLKAHVVRTDEEEETAQKD